MSTLVVVNPAAGGGRCGPRADEVLPRLAERGFSHEAVRTEGPGHASELARRAWERGVRRFVCVGGDGTTYEVLNGLFPAADKPDDPVRLGFLPLGTGNSFVRDFAITTEDEALRALLSGRERPCDVVRATWDGGELHYLNLLSLGFSAEAGDLTNRRFKRLGAAGYVAAVLITLARLRHPVFPIRIDGGEIDARPAALLSFCNSGYTAGTMNMAPGADVADGQLDVIRVGALGRPRFLATFPKIFKGTHTASPGIEHRHARAVDLDLPGPVQCMIDGEIVTLALRRLEVRPRAVRVLA